MKSLKRVIPALLLVLLIAALFSGCGAGADSPLTSDAETLSIPFETADGRLEVWRLAKRGSSAAATLIGHAVLEDGKIAELLIDNPAYPWEQDGALDEYGERIFSRAESVSATAAETGSEIVGLIACDTFYYAVLQNDSGQLVYSLHTGSPSVTAAPMDVFIGLVNDYFNSDLSGGGPSYTG